MTTQDSGTVSKGLAAGKVGTLSGAMLGISCVAPGYTLTASIGVIVALVSVVVVVGAVILITGGVVQNFVVNDMAVDTITGAGGADVIDGGSGNDVFKYTATLAEGLDSVGGSITGNGYVFVKIIPYLEGWTAGTLPGGTLTIRHDEEGGIHMAGPASEAFRGTFELDDYS